MAYIVTENIIDTKDNNRLYEKGEVYPRFDLNVSDARIRALLKKGVIESDGFSFRQYNITLRPV